MNSRLYILAIVALGFTARIVAACLGPVFLDESYFAYQAGLLLKGQIPFVNFISYPPVPLVGMALSISLLGQSVLAMRFFSVICDTITVYLVYAIASDFLGTRVGLASALFYAVTPMTIWMGTVANEMPATVCLFMLALFLFERSTERSDRLLFLSGIAIGVGWFSSRTVALLGASALIYLVASGLRNRSGISSILRKVLVLIVGSVIILAPVYLFFLTRLDFSQMNLLYGLGGTSLSSPIPKMSIDLNLKVVNQTLVQGLPVFGPAAAFLVMMLVSSIRVSRVLRTLTFLLPAALVAFLLIVPQAFAPNVNYGVVPLYSQLFPEVDVLVVILVLIFFVVYPSLRNIGAVPSQRPKADLYPLLLVLALVLAFYEYYGWTTGALSSYYFFETMAICSIFAGAWGVFVFERSKGRTVTFKILAISCLAVLLMAGYVNFYAYSNSYTGERPYSVSLVNEVSQYIASHTGSNGTIFAEPIFAYLADRSDILNFYTLTLEYTRGGVLPGVPGGLVPTDSEFIQLLQSQRVGYIILDDRLYSVAPVDLPLTSKYIDAFYAPVKTFGTNYSEYALSGNPQPYPIVVLNRSAYWNAGEYAGYYPYVQAGAASQPSGIGTANYTFSSPGQAYLLSGEPVVTANNSILELSPVSDASGVSYVQFTMPNNPYTDLDVSYSAATTSGCSTGTNYDVLVNAQGSWQQLYSGPIGCALSSASIDLSRYLGITISVRVVPYTNSTSTIPTIDTSIVFQSSAAPLLSYPGLASLLSVYDSRTDLRADYVGVGSANTTGLMELVNWAAGVVNHRFADSDYGRLLQFGWYYTLMSIYNSRPDLQKAYPNAYSNQISRGALFCWANNVVTRAFVDSSYSILSQYTSTFEGMNATCP